MNHNPTSDSSENRTNERALNDKFMELQALFEFSQILNSSLRLKSILDNMLLTPMGKMMISKGIILLNQGQDLYQVETCKGLPRTLINRQVYVAESFHSPVFVHEIDNGTADWNQFFKNLGIEILLPITSNRQNLGLIGLGKKITGTEYSESELDFLNSISNIAAASVENGLMFHELNTVNRRLDKKVQELKTLFEIGKELNSTLDVDKIINLLVYTVMGEMVVNRVVIFLKAADKFEFSLSRGLENSEINPHDLVGPELQALLSTIVAPIIIANTVHDKPELEPLHEMGFSVIVPLRIQEQNEGVLLLGPKITTTPFYDNEMEYLATLGNQAMISLANARLFEEALEKKALEEEMNIAREIQQQLFPAKLPPISGFDIAATNISSRQVGGDYYDCIQLDDDNFGIAIGDVSGKGAPASLLMANVQATLHALIHTELPIADMIAKINHITHENTTPDKFITFFYGILNTRTRTFTYCNAGHNPPYHFHADGSFDLLETGGLLLGMFSNMPYETGQVQLKPGDWLMLYTDGVNEAINPREEEFGTDNIEQILQHYQGESARNMLSSMLAAVHKFADGTPQSDDITMVILKDITE